MGIVISTSWNAFRFTEGKSLVKEIKELGFNEIECSFNLTSEIVKDIEDQLASGLIKVRSLHNYCPIPKELSRKIALPDYYSVASVDSNQRNLAVKNTKNTIDTAKRLGAKAVVLHTGRIEIPDRTKDLIAFYNNGRCGCKEYQELKNEIIADRKDNYKDFFQSALKSLDELNTYAQKKDIYIGVETRYYYREIPILEELAEIIRVFDNSNIFYWHDCGHAQVMEKLGLVNKHEDFLEIAKGRILGFHLHDIKGCSDHQAIGNGDFDFARLKPYVDKDVIKVLEAHQQASAKEMIKSRLILEKMFE